MKTFLLPGVILLLAVALLPSVQAISACSAGSAFWATFYGTVTVNTNTTTSGALVRAFGNNDSTNNSYTIVGSGQAPGYYNIVVCVQNESAADKFHFRVWDLNASPTNGSPQTFPGAGEYRELALRADTKASGGTCTFAQSCTSGFCTDGFCCNSACGGASEDCNIAGAAGTCTSTAAASSSTGGGGTTSTPTPSPTTTITTTPAPTTPTTPSPTTPTTPPTVPTVPTVEPTPETPVTEVITVPEIVADVPVTIEIQNKQETGVQTIAIITSSGASNVAVTVERTESKPPTITAPPSSFKVFSYLKIETSNIAKEDVKEAQITFHVTKQWLRENGLGKEGVALGRLAADGIWRELPTDIVGEDSETVIYLATSPGFSYFAVMARTRVAATPGPAPLFGFIDMQFLVILVIVVFIVAAVFFFLKRKK